MNGSQLTCPFDNKAWKIPLSHFTRSVVGIFAVPSHLWKWTAGRGPNVKLRITFLLSSRISPAYPLNISPCISWYKTAAATLAVGNALDSWAVDIAAVPFVGQTPESCNSSLLHQPSKQRLARDPLTWYTDGCDFDCSWEKKHCSDNDKLHLLLCMTKPLQQH